MSILNRIADLLSANIGTIANSSEDPEKAVEDYLRVMRTDFQEARAATAMAMAEETRLRARYEAGKSEVEEWQRKAEVAVHDNEEEAARDALRRKNDAQVIADIYESQWITQHDQVAELRGSLQKLEARILEAEARLDGIIARSRRAQTQQTVAGAMQQAALSQSPSTDLQKVEDTLDARATRAGELTTRATDAIDNHPSEGQTQSQVEIDLAELKRKMGKA